MKKRRSFTLQRAKRYFRKSDFFFLSNYFNLPEAGNLSWICQVHRVEPRRIMRNRLGIPTTKTAKTKGEKERKEALALKLPAAKM